ncbi:phage tail protein [Staphylococcus shinii]|nr:phage tail protein [Staphylococcus shinii]
MSASDKRLVVLPEDNKLKLAEGMLVSDMTEGEIKQAAELWEKVVAGKTDYGYKSVSEEGTFTMTNVPGDKGQKQFLEAIKNRKQLRVWLVDVKLNQANDESKTQYHNSIFGYAVVEENTHKFDDEDDTIEVTLKFKFNTAEGPFPKMPDAWINPSEAMKVEFETPNQYTGSLEERKKVTGA